MSVALDVDLALLCPLLDQDLPPILHPLPFIRLDSYQNTDVCVCAFFVTPQKNNKSWLSLFPFQTTKTGVPPEKETSDIGPATKLVPHQLAKKKE